MKSEHVEIDLDSSKGNLNFVEKARESLVSQLENLQEADIGSTKFHGRRRPKREIRDIANTRGNLIGRIEHALRILDGRQEGTVKFIKDVRTGKILGFRVMGEKK